MKLRKSLCILAASLLLLLAGCASEPETPEPEFALTYAENQPEGYPTVLGAQRFAELVKERTEGRVIIRGGSGQHDKAIEALREVVAIHTCEHRIAALTVDRRMILIP